MAAKRARTAVNILDLVDDGLAQLLQQQTDALTSDDTPLSEEAAPASIHFIEAIQYGGLTEEQYKEQHPDNWRILMRELDPNYIDPQTPAQQPEQRVALSYTSACCLYDCHALDHQCSSSNRLTGDR
jgi:hypothetical protein